MERSAAELVKKVGSANARVVDSVSDASVKASASAARKISLAFMDASLEALSTVADTCAVKLATKESCVSELAAASCVATAVDSEAT